MAMALSIQFQVDPHPSCTLPADAHERRDASFREPSILLIIDHLDLLRISPARDCY